MTCWVLSEEFLGIETPLLTILVGNIFWWLKRGSVGWLSSRQGDGSWERSGNRRDKTGPCELKFFNRLLWPTTFNLLSCWGWDDTLESTMPIREIPHLLHISSWRFAIDSPYTLTIDVSMNHFQCDGGASPHPRYCDSMTVGESLHIPFLCFIWRKSSRTTG